MHDDPIMKADGFDEAIIGEELLTGRLVYSKSKCIEILMRDMSEEDAEDYFGFNILGAYVGEGTPLFIQEGYESDR